MFNTEDIFKNMDTEKKDRIINSALEEFSKYSFDKASTNNIVKNALISKGLLFHYFSSKKELYDKLEKFVIEIVINDLVEKINWDISDFFERTKEIVMIKWKVTNRYPYIYDFFMTTLENNSIDEIKEKSEIIAPNLTNKIYTHNIDYSLFKDNIDIQKAMTIIRWTFEKYGEEIVYNKSINRNELDYKEIDTDIQQYIDVLKKAFYK